MNPMHLYPRNLAIGLLVGLLNATPAGRKRLQLRDTIERQIDTQLETPRTEPPLDFQAAAAFPIFEVLVETQDGEHSYTSKRFVSAKNEMAAEKLVHRDYPKTHYKRLEHGRYQERASVGGGYRIDSIGIVRRHDTLASLLGALGVRRI